jgi:hypothetical protein
MALRKLVSKFVLPSLDRDLSRSVSMELSVVADMVDNMLAPQAFAYGSMSSTSSKSGTYQPSSNVYRNVAPSEILVGKIVYPVTSEGLFQDVQHSFHSRTG